MEESYLETAAEFDKNGDHEQALVYYMKALEERKAAVGEKHPDVAVLCTTIGRTLNDQGDYDNAVSYYEKALEICRAVYKSYYLQAAALCEAIGSILEDNGERDGALAHYENSLDACRRAYGEYHPCLIALHEKIEKLLIDKGDEENARVHHERAHKLEMIRLGLDVPDEDMKQMQEEKEQLPQLHEIEKEDVLYLICNKCKFKLGEKTTIGRADDNDLIVDDRLVSRHHCTIQKIKDAYFLKDTDSTNGTFLNGRRVSLDTYVRLESGYTICLGFCTTIEIR